MATSFPPVTTPAPAGGSPAGAGPAGTGPASGGRAAAALSGVLAAGLTIAVAELVAALLQRTGHAGGTPSPVLAVGAAFVDRTPRWLKDLAVSTFGTHDKTVLLLGIAVVLVGAASVAGLLAARRRGLGLAVVVVLAAVAGAAVLSRPGAAALDLLPTVAGGVAGLRSLDALSARARAVVRPGLGIDRRAFVRLAGGTGAAAVLGGGLAQLLGRSTQAALASRAAVALPAPAAPDPLPTGAALDSVPGLSPLVTPADAFYRIDTALSVPQVSTDTWRLRVHGMVDQEVELSFAELLAMPLVERMVTLSCVSNEVGGDLVGNQVWRGYLLRDLMRRARPAAGADMVLSTSADGWTAATPLDALTDPRRDAMLAVGMDGRPLPIQHGFPVRMVVPGLYGYVSATKWVVDLEVTRFDRAGGYWTSRGWSVKGPIKTESRIDVPRAGAHVRAGQVAVAGVAWAPHRGISRVQVRVDDGPWQAADVGTGGSADTWRQWVWRWDATVGDHVLAVRATDGTGEVQTARRADPAPDGATGWHTVQVSVT